MHYLLAFCIGIILMGANTYRTLKAYEGHLVSTFIATVLGSLMLWYGTQYINNNDCLSYGAYSMGCALVSVAIAYDYQKKRKNNET